MAWVLSQQRVLTPVATEVPRVFVCVFCVVPALTAFMSLLNSQENMVAAHIYLFG